MPCFLPERNLLSSFVSLCPPLSNSFCTSPGVTDPCSSQRNLDSYQMQCSKLLIPARPFIGRDLFHLLSVIRERGPDVLVDTGLLDAVCEWAPRFS